LHRRGIKKTCEVLETSQVFGILGLNSPLFCTGEGKKDLRGFRNLAGFWDFGTVRYFAPEREKKDLRGFRNLAGLWDFGTEQPLFCTGEGKKRPARF